MCHLDCEEIAISELNGLALEFLADERSELLPNFIVNVTAYAVNAIQIQSIHISIVNTMVDISFGAVNAPIYMYT